MADFLKVYILVYGGLGHILNFGSKGIKLMGDKNFNKFGNGI